MSSALLKGVWTRHTQVFVVQCALQCLVQCVLQRWHVVSITQSFFGSPYTSMRVAVRVAVCVYLFFDFPYTGSFYLDRTHVS